MGLGGIFSAQLFDGVTDGILEKKKDDNAAYLRSAAHSDYYGWEWSVGKKTWYATAIWT